jgi:hypothetical protein
MKRQDYKIYEAKLEAYEEARYDVGQLEMEVDGWRQRAEEAEAKLKKK